MRLRPFFSYYGSKWRLSPRYDEPLHGTVIEPFAGSACYSLYWHHKAVRLYDKSQVICSIWEYLINVSEAEVRKLPILKPGQAIPLSLPEEARNLMGFWVTKGAAAPGKSMTRNRNLGHWSPTMRERIASQLQYIRHWSITQSCYLDIPNTEATWFIDPPYKVGGHKYTENKIDFPRLAEYCRTRKGQVTVCENGEAGWLPFTTFASTKGLKKTSAEVVWTNQ
jgi:hypothetical protein